MDDGSARGRLSFMGRPLPAPFEVRVVVVPAGCERAVNATEWRDVLVVVERGQIELRRLGGACWSFVSGDVLWLIGLSACTLNNAGLEPTVLVAVSRRPRGLRGTNLRSLAK